MSSAASRNRENQHGRPQPLESKLPPLSVDQQNLGELDRKLAEVLADRAPEGGPARILVAGGETASQRNIVDWLTERHHQCTAVARLDEARAAAARCRFDLVMLNPRLPDGDGFDLARLVQQTSPTTRTIVFSENRTTEIVTDAMRCGSSDFLSVPLDPSELTRCVDSALLQSRIEQHREDRMARLKRICSELNTARHEISEQVNLLCQDLVDAYRGITDQVNDVAVATELRTVLRQELDVEDLLRTTLEYMLTKTGPTNAAVFLPDAQSQYGLGAYVNYDCPRDSLTLLLDHLCQAICPQMEDETEIVSFADAREFAQWIDIEASFLADSQVIAFSCRHEGECLAVVVLFRSKADPFDDVLPSFVDMMRTVFAEQLATVIRVHHRTLPQWPEEPCDEDRDLDDDFNADDYGELAA